MTSRINYLPQALTISEEILQFHLYIYFNCGKHDKQQAVTPKLASYACTLYLTDIGLLYLTTFLLNNCFQFYNFWQNL